jgi:uncharacterized membrane protein YfcA
MHIDPGVVIAGLIVGFTVGLTGMGGGALMTPILVLLFNVQPLAAVSSDLVNSLIMKPVGAGVHFRRGTVQWPLVKWLVIGSVPAAFSGAFILDKMAGDGFEDHLKLLLGYALLVAAIAMIAKAVLQSRANRRLAALGLAPNEVAFTIKPIPTLLIGVAGGLIVGMTSVGSGSLMIVLLMLLYPRLSAKSLVGTDLIQAIPLVAAATLGHVFFGDIDLGLTGALLIGSLPGVYVGARFSAKAPDVVIRPALIFVLAASSLKLLGMGTTTLGVVLVLMVIVAAPLWAAVDAATRPTVQWHSAKQRSRWVSLLGIGAPFGVGFIGSIFYVTTVRRRFHTIDEPSDSGTSEAVPAAI